jgi:hypothetical protein
MSRHLSASHSAGQSPVAAAKITIGRWRGKKFVATASSSANDSNGRCSLRRGDGLSTPSFAGLTSIIPQTTARASTCRSACARRSGSRTRARSARRRSPLSGVPGPAARRRRRRPFPAASAASDHHPLDVVLAYLAGAENGRDRLEFGPRRRRRSEEPAPAAHAGRRIEVSRCDHLL